MLFYHSLETSKLSDRCGTCAQAGKEACGYYGVAPYPPPLQGSALLRELSSRKGFAVGVAPTTSSVCSGLIAINNGFLSYEPGVSLQVSVAFAGALLLSYAKVVLTERFALPTCRLSNDCSTIELSEVLSERVDLTLASNVSGGDSPFLLRWLKMAPTQGLTPCRT